MGEVQLGLFLFVVQGFGWLTDRVYIPYTFLHLFRERRLFVQKYAWKLGFNCGYIYGHGAAISRQLNAPSEPYKVALFAFC